VGFRLWFLPVFGQASGKLNGSKLKFEGELDRARAADLIQRIEAAALAARASYSASGWNSRIAERSVVDGRAELRVIEDVEKIGAGLQRGSRRTAGV